ncbi:MAG: endo alpha-1,4 polygalactosaminidase [Sandaracinaceae bacterium]
MRRLALVLAACAGCDGPSGSDVGTARDAGASAVDARAVDADAFVGAPTDGSVDVGTRPDAGPIDGGALAPRLPPPNAGLDYQLGGAYPPPSGVGIVSRDRNADPAPGLYNVCYVNGFQIQPDEEAFWLAEHPDLILRDASGAPVIDADWDEMLLDVGTPERRAAIAEIVGAWIDGCAARGFDAVEIDNLDTFSRSSGLLSEDDCVAQMALFSARAHARGLAIAQKNAAELVGRRAELGTDFVVAEECNRYDECDVYTRAYGDAVLVIEYRRADFEAGCAAFPDLSIVLRDIDLVPPGRAGYVYDGC